MVEQELHTTQIVCILMESNKYTAKLASLFTTYYHWRTRIFYT